MNTASVARVLSRRATFTTARTPARPHARTLGHAPSATCQGLASKHAARVLVNLYALQLSDQVPCGGAVRCGAV